MNAIRTTALFLAALLVIAAPPAPAPAQGLAPLTGSWALHRNEGGRLHLRLWSDDRGHDFENENPIEPSDLGLSDARIAASPAAAQFSMLREAGTFAFSGTLGNDGGNGTFTFTPSSAFTSGLDARNLHYRDTQSIMAAAQLNVTLAYIDQIRAAGFPAIAYDTLLGFHALGVTPGSIGELRSVFGKVSADDVLSATAMHVTRAYVDELNAMHVGNVTPNRAVAFKSLNINRAYLNELARNGFPDLPADQILAFKAMHIDAAYLQHLASHGFKHLTAEQVIELKAENL